MALDGNKIANKVLDKDINSLLVIFLGVFNIGLLVISGYFFKEIVELEMKNQALLVKIHEKQSQILYKRCRPLINKYCRGRDD